MMSRLLAILGCLLLAGASPASESAPQDKVALISDIVHEPTQPKPNIPVLIKARIAPGATKVVLKLQAVAPGKYIAKSDPAYEKEWLEFPMHDDGQDGDAKAGDGIYSVRIPASYQKHRWLLRYRILVTSKEGKTVQEPLAAEASPNYAWWCDAGPATWKGTRDPGKTPVLTFSSQFLGTLQSIQLIAKAEEVAKSQWDGGAHKQKQQGTIIYKGVVYDHIRYSNRGQGSAHISGKNKWSLKFNPDEEIPFVDHNGVPFAESCASLNLNPGGCTPYLPVHRGIAGLDEVLSFRAYRLAGVPSPPATWIQWRVITQPDEVSARDQYQGDLWGLYVAIGEMTPKQLSDTKLPNGLTFSTQSGIKHTPKGMADADKLWEKFVNTMRSNPKESWWRENLDLKAFFSFHAMNRLLGNVDLRPDGNHGYYRHPDGHWAPIPWDLDMMFVPRHHQPGVIDAVACLNHPKIALEYRNRAREILDLFASDYSPKGGQIGQLTIDLGKVLTPPGFNVDWPRLDEAVWNQNPHMNQKGSYYLNPTNAEHFGGAWKRTLATNDFAGFQKYIVEFCTDSRPTKNYAPNDGDQRGYGWGYLNFEAKEDKIPATARVERLPGNSPKFKATSFESSAGDKSAALEWRVGRVGKKGWYELGDHWRKETGAGLEVEVPTEIFKESGVYRVRARWRDQTGRCGHWSNPLEITTK
ncbi:CotH kinase family protein [Telmatocola sphagniphila]|uniref:CotH kinase family protein n=2 Tax=Telmatocola sphagniphila TaxID=1123043 RepID=A0A8E6BBH7_9BACT|nr:CotH kinase family protein [Telmatocola sphagniphila]